MLTVLKIIYSLVIIFLVFLLGFQLGALYNQSIIEGRAKEIKTTEKENQLLETVIFGEKQL